MDIGFLNPQQQKAIQTVNGPLLVLAGAGTGKTTVITYRVGWMLKNGIRPDQIMGVTFTNKAAAVMKQKITQLLPEVNHRSMYIGTFHSFGYRMLWQFIDRLGYSPQFGIADADDQEKLIKDIVRESGLSGSDLKLDFFIRGIRDAKNRQLTENDIRQSGSMPWFQKLADVYVDYQAQLKKQNLVDFDDLIALPCKIWREYPETLEICHKRFQYLLVDEYQDTNANQSQLIDLLVGIKQNVCVVGDDDQSIYGWRGAEVKNILLFKERYPNAAVIKLEQNYRSTTHVLAAANNVIAHNFERHPKALWTAREDGERLQIIHLENEQKEAKLVTRLIEHLLYEMRLTYKDFLVLIRSNFQSRLYELAFHESHIPYRIVGAKSFYESREIKDALAYLKILYNPHDEISLLRIINVPARGIGDKTLEKLLGLRQQINKPLLMVMSSPEAQKILPPGAWAKLHAFNMTLQRWQINFQQSGRLAEKIKEYLTDMEFFSSVEQLYRDKDERDQKARSDNLNEFIISATLLEERLGHMTSLSEFLQTYGLMDDQDRVKEENRASGNSVNLMTVHAAKGTEFPVVIIVGLEEEFFPHARSLEENGLEEERRLFYVALTRAQQRVYMTWAHTRAKFYQRERRYPSRFIHELPPEHVNHTKERDIFLPANPTDVAAVFADMKNRF